MKLCSDCRHFRPYTYTQEDGDCRHPSVVYIHPVSGAQRYPSAFTQRTSLNRTSCGDVAQNWDYDPGAPPEPQGDEGEQL